MACRIAPSSARVSARRAVVCSAAPRPQHKPLSAGLAAAAASILLVSTPLAVHAGPFDWFKSIQKTAEQKLPEAEREVKAAADSQDDTIAQGAKDQLEITKQQVGQLAEEAKTGKVSQSARDAKEGLESQINSAKSILGK